MPTKIAVNLPVRDLPRSTRFFGALGFPSDQRLATENTAAHAISDDIYVILVTDAHFKTITKKQTLGAIRGLGHADRRGAHAMTGAHSCRGTGKRRCGVRGDSRRRGRLAAAFSPR